MGTQLAPVKMLDDVVAMSGKDGRGRFDGVPGFLSQHRYLSSFGRFHADGMFAEPKACTVLQAC
jgi:hypothetical protein